MLVTLNSALGRSSSTGVGLPGAAPQPHAVVEVTDLGKTYGPHRVLSGVSFRIAPGETFGILGPNGAGKTTLIEILEGLRLASEGSATVLGCPSHELPTSPAVKRRIGVAAQAASLPQTLTVLETLEFFATINNSAENVPGLVDALALGSLARKQVRRLSGGQQQRVALAAALVGDPDLLFLDEPTAQLDPIGCERLWHALRSTRRSGGRTLIVTTHRMDEAQAHCDRVMIINHGRIMALDTPANLIRQHAPGVIVSFQASADMGLPGLRAVDSADGQRRWVIQTEDLDPTLQRLFARARTAQANIQDLRLEPQTLRDVFVNLAAGA